MASDVHFSPQPRSPRGRLDRLATDRAFEPLHIWMGVASGDGMIIPKPG
jgi:hypothetical protein